MPTRLLYATGPAGRAWRIAAGDTAITYGPRGEAPSEAPWSGRSLGAACVVPSGLWVATDDGIARHLPGGTERAIGACDAIASDDRGRLWVAAGGALRSLDAGSSRTVAPADVTALVLSADGRRLYAAMGERITAYERDTREEVLLRPGARFGALALTPAGLVAFDAAAGELLGINLFHRTLAAIATGLPALASVAFDRPGRALVAVTTDESVLEIPTDGSGPARSIPD